MAIDPRHDPRDQPIVQTHFDYRDNRVVLFQRHERPTEIILICHGIAPLIRGRRPRSLLYRTPHSISKRTTRRPTRQPFRGRLIRLDGMSETDAQSLRRGSGDSMYTRKAYATREASR